MTAKKIGIASDHRGVQMKAQILAQIRDAGFEGVDFGPATDAQVDYPDFAALVSSKVASGEIDRGILVCGTGMGMCIAANKFDGVRAVTCHDDVTAEMGRRHNDANVMCLSADMLGDKLLSRIVEIFLNAEFEGAEGSRHARRLDKIREIERSQHHSS